MPKMKTKSSAKKRFFPLKSGKVKRACAYMRHNLSTKGTTAKRNLRNGEFVPETSMVALRKMLPYGAR